MPNVPQIIGRKTRFYINSATTIIAFYFAQVEKEFQTPPSEINIKD